MTGGASGEQSGEIMQRVIDGDTNQGSTKNQSDNVQPGIEVVNDGKGNDAAEKNRG